jgi:plastocyanin
MRTRPHATTAVLAMFVTAAALAAWLGAGCSGGNAHSASVSPVDGSGAITVVVDDGAYSAERIEVQSGATTAITLQNDDAGPHTLTVYLGSAPAGEIAADTGEVASHEQGEAVVFFAAPGEHAFRCEVHPETMHGMIVVR